MGKEIKKYHVRGCVKALFLGVMIAIYGTGLAVCAEETEYDFSENAADEEYSLWTAENEEEYAAFEEKLAEYADTDESSGDYTEVTATPALSSGNTENTQSHHESEEKNNSSRRIKRGSDTKTDSTKTTGNASKKNANIPDADHKILESDSKASPSDSKTSESNSRAYEADERTVPTDLQTQTRTDHTRKSEDPSESDSEAANTGVITLLAVGLLLLGAILTVGLILKKKLGAH